MNSPSVVRAHLYLLLYAVLIATSFPLASYLGQSYSPLLTTLARFSLAAIGFVVLLQKQRLLRGISVSQLLRYSAISLPLTGFFLLMFIAGESASAIDMSSISTTVPLFSVLFAYFGWRQRSSAVRVMALLLGVFGALWLISNANISSLGQGGWPIGNSIFLAACALMGLYPLILKQLHRGEPMLVITGWSLITGCGWLGLAVAAIQPAWQLPTSTQMAAILWLAVATTMVTFFLFQSASMVVGGSSANAYSLLTPAAVLLLNVGMGGGWPQPLVAVGVVPIIVALLWLLLQDRQT
ncbi:DMT family transporter [Ferrimonas lipolytica]|uniref:DMT family transporter n=1 Tax=Ferrimonas lipolytica TaxID=2724191 RepID=A0A6H1UGK0_9GAMM|nr:DMT family transporter [Ferrimonas lipolytica]QIZ78235.1 DMT family transporter [Ferrimonas lipolytica]